jgi:hypothetical protein
VRRHWRLLHAFSQPGVAATSETSYDARLARRTVPPGRECVGPLLKVPRMRLAKCGDF